MLIYTERESITASNIIFPVFVSHESSDTFIEAFTNTSTLQSVRVLVKNLTANLKLTASRKSLIKIDDLIDSHCFYLHLKTASEIGASFSYELYLWLPKFQATVGRTTTAPIFENILKIF